MSKTDKALLSDGFNHPTPDGQTIAYTVDDATPGSPIGSGFDQTSGKSYLNTLTTDFPSGTVGGVTNGHDPIDLSYHFKRLHWRPSQGIYRRICAGVLCYPNAVLLQ